jgi:hypothetical protein
MEALAEGSAAVDASPEPLEDLPAEEPPSLGTGDDSATDSGVEPAAAGAAVATGPAVDAGPASIPEQAPPAAATEGPSIFEITPCQDVIDGQQQQEHEEMAHTENPAAAAAAAAAVEGHLKGSAPAEAAAAAAVTPYNKLFAEISSQLNQSEHSQLQEEDEDAKTAVHLQLQPPAAAAEAAYEKVVNAGAITLTKPQDDYADCCMGVAAAMDTSVPTAAAAAAAAAPWAPSSRPQSPLHSSSSSSSSRRQAGFKARAVTLKAVLQVNRKLLLTSVLPAAAGAVLAIAGSCSLAQARRLRRQQQVLMAAMATASATTAAAAAADGDDDGEQPSVPAGEVAGGRVRGMVVYRGTARRICSL